MARREGERSRLGARPRSACRTPTRRRSRSTRASGRGRRARSTSRSAASRRPSARSRRRAYGVGQSAHRRAARVSVPDVAQAGCAARRRPTTCWRCAGAAGRPATRSATRRPAHGVPLVSAARWDTGVQVHAANAFVEATAAVTVGTLSDPRFSDDNGGPQVAGRVALHPNAGLVVGVSASRGALRRPRRRRARRASDWRSLTQQAWGADVEYSRDYYLVRVESVCSAVAAALDRRRSDRRAADRARPRPSKGATRSARVLRGGARRPPRLQRDHRQPPARARGTRRSRRIEIGGGYSIQRNLIAKLSYQYNTRDGGRVRSLGAGRVPAASSGSDDDPSGCRSSSRRWRRSARPRRPAPSAARGGTIRGRVELKEVPKRIERRPRSPTSARRCRPATTPTPTAGGRSSISSRRRAAPSSPTAPAHAMMDQRNETFVPHVLAITTGTVVDFPEQRPHLPQRVLALEARALRPRALRRRPLEVGPLRPAGHRARLLRHPLAHERLHPGVQPPVLRGDRRRGALSHRQRAARDLQRDRLERGRRRPSRRQVTVTDGGAADLDFTLR